MKTIRIMAWNWLEPLYLEAIEDKETPGRYALHLSEAQLIVDAWKNAPKEEGMTVREWSYSTHGDTFFVTALYDAGELNIDYWMPDGLYWTDQMPFDFEISESTVWTVIGFWDEDEPVVAGIVAGQHDVVGGDAVSEGGPWAVSITAPHSDEAAVLAVLEMKGSLVADEEPVAESPQPDILSLIMDYESGQLDDDQTIALFQTLIDNGMISQLQGTYQRTARSLLDLGLVTPPKE